MRADADLRTALRHIASQQAVDASAVETGAAIVDEQGLAAVADRPSHAYRLRPTAYHPSTRVLARSLRASRWLRPCENDRTVFQPLAQGMFSGLVERNNTFLAAFAHHANHARAQIHAVDVERFELAQTKSRRVHQ